MPTTLPLDAWRTRSRRGHRLLALTAAGPIALAACTGGGAGSPASAGAALTSTEATTGGTIGTTGGTTGSTEATGGGTTGTTGGGTTGIPGSSATSPAVRPSCTDRLVARLTPDQRVGQLFVAGIQPGQGPGGLDATIRSEHIGGVVLLGGWDGAGAVSATSSHVQAQATASATGGVRMLVAADQEGGQVQQLKGSGFTTLPSALSQARASTAVITANSATAGRELKAVGVNVNLAPVADTVPASIGRQNAPIGRYSREYGNDPATVARNVTAAVTGLRSGGVTATVKHFPGLGRVSGNTDVTDSGITDSVATATDPYLEPFQRGIAVGAELVMVSSARYPRIDPDNPAVFSSPVISGLLRGSLRYAGVVVTDDVGVAKAVAAVPPGDRAVRFVGAGGDVILTASASLVPAMTAALQARAGRDPGFAAQLDASVRRVLELKQRMGLAGCG